MNTYEFSARCASGFEAILADELRELGIKRVRPQSGGVAFFSTVEQAYAACLWCRTASRVLLVLSRFAAGSAQELYDGVHAIDWTDHIPDSDDATIAVQARGTNANLRNTQFTAVKVKDAICDVMRDKTGRRPTVFPSRPDVQINIAIHASKATLSIDFAGESLHRRGYRQDGVQVTAPLKEALAAGILLASDWPAIACQGGAFVDPMCGSATFAIEAAMIAAHMAPGLLRDYWGFEGWVGHDEDAWQRVLDEADECLETGLESMPPIYASDIDARCVRVAQGNAQRVGLAKYIHFHVMDVADAAQVFQGDVPPVGLMAVNPPYGERLSTTAQLPATYAALAQGAAGLRRGWHLALISPDGDMLDSALGLQPTEVRDVYNGDIEATLRVYQLGAAHRTFATVTNPETGKDVQVPVALSNTQQFADRLKKVARERRKWARKNNIAAYRIYDSDLPDYAVAIERFEGAGASEGKSYLSIAEYQAPSDIDEEVALQRMNDVIAVAPEALGVPADKVFVRTRRRDKGGRQYKSDGSQSYIAYTSEAGYLFELDLAGHLDTGLFLDHRITRALVGDMCKNKRFLNLFAYTGAATVHAAGAGAKETCTVDLSNTYLDWAKRNMQLNGFHVEGDANVFECADVTRWITDERRGKRRWDVIFVDPPTFSNSKSMGERTWSVQRDHVELLIGVTRLLTENGVAVFSCNLRNFKPDIEKLSQYGVSIEDISGQTIPADFERNPRIHRCFKVRRKK